MGSVNKMNGEPVVLILAAGASSRMGPGRDKLLEPVSGVPLIVHVARLALETGLRVIVTLPPDRPARLAALRGAMVAQDGAAVETLIVSDAASGMAASFRAGVRAAWDAPALITVLGDMPDLDSTDIAAVLSAWRESPDRPVRGASAEGIPGQPVIFPASLFPALAELTGDAGGRSVLAGQDTRLILLRGQHAITDLDTPEDWAIWRARR